MEIVWLLILISCFVGLFKWFRPFKVEPPFSIYHPRQQIQLKDKLSFYKKLCSADFIEALSLSLETLSEIGWSEAVLSEVYLGCLSEQSDVAELRLLEKQARLFGSDLFLAMWQAEWIEQSPSRARQLLHIGLKTLGLEKGLTSRSEEVDTYLSAIAPIGPDHAFWRVLARLVQYAFPEKSLSTDGDLARGVHQLRYLISLQQAQWIRENYGGQNKSDRDALLSYLSKKDAKDSLSERLGLSEYDFDFDLRESARLHNKLAFTKDGQAIPSLSIPNLKILIHFHSELILDASGRFANILDRTENGVVNGASFNYASRNDKRHWELDILPVKTYDPRFRKETFKTPRHRYYSPARLPIYLAIWQRQNWLWSYFNPKGYYAQDDLSMARQVYQARKTFERDLRKIRRHQ